MANATTPQQATQAAKKMASPAEKTRKLSEETKQKISKALMGNQNARKS